MDGIKQGSIPCLPQNKELVGVGTQVVLVYIYSTIKFFSFNVRRKTITN